MEVGLVLIFVVVLFISYLFISRPKNLPPGPLAIPYLGSLGILRAVKKKRPHLVLCDLAKQYGPVFSFAIGKRRVIVLTGYDAIREALVKQSDIFSDRPTDLPLIASFIKDGGGVLFNNYNHEWKVLRRFTLQALRDFGVGKSSLEERIQVEIEATTKWYRDHADQPIDINSSIQKIIGNVIYGIVFGIRYDYDDEKYENIRLLTNTLFSGDGPLNAMNFLPAFVVEIMRHFSKQRGVTEAKGNAEKIESFLKEKVEEHEETFDENNIRDFVDLHIKTSRDHEKDNSEFSKGNLFRVINDLFIAGSETTSTTLDWVFLYMVENPDILEKCQAEIQEAVGDRYIQYNDRDKLPYLNATLMEIQRLTTIVPMSVSHRVIKETTLNGYIIPSGALVVPHLFSACRDPKYWTDPDTFNPDRFLDEFGKLLKADALVPFSMGPRQCLGEPLAKMELFLVFSNLIQRFNFQRENEAVKHSMQSRPFNITNIPLPYKVWIKSRR